MKLGALIPYIICRYVAFKLKIKMSEYVYYKSDVYNNDSLKISNNYIVLSSGKIFANRVPIKSNNIKVFVFLHPSLYDLFFYISDKRSGRTVLLYFLPDLMYVE